MFRRSCALAGVFAYFVIGASCGVGAGDAQERGPRSALVPSLCESLGSASAGRLAEAKAIFDDQVHEALHVLASDAAAVDRSVAARLLEAKQVVEARFAQLDPSVSDALVPLVAATSVALTSVGVTARSGCEE